MSKIAITIGAVLVPGVGVAHPEHFSRGGFGVAHYLTDPFHVALGCAAVFFFVAALRFVRRPHPMNRQAQ